MYITLTHYVNINVRANRNKNLGGVIKSGAKRGQLTP